MSPRKKKLKLHAEAPGATRPGASAANAEIVGDLLRKARQAEHDEEYATAIGLYDDAIAYCDSSNTDPAPADLHRWKGTVLRERGETEAAHRCYTESLRMAKRARSLPGEAHALNCLANIALRRGDQKETDRLYTAAAAIAEKLGDQRLLGMIEQNRGVLANIRGEFAVAAACYENSLAAFESTADEEPMSWILNNLGMLNTRLEQFEKSKEYLERGLSIAVTRNDRTVENVITLNLAEAFVGLGRLDIADELLARALGQAGRRGDHLTAAGALKLRALVERKRGALDKALATLRIAIYEAEGAEDQLLNAEMLRELGEISRALGNAGAAKSAWREAVTSYTAAGAAHEIAGIEAQLSELQ